MPSQPVIAVSLVQLLVYPERYVGQRVGVDGYLSTSMNLYLTSEHAKAHDALSSIIVSDADDGGITYSDCVDSFVSITATFIHLEYGQYALVNVTRIHRTQPHPETGDCWSRTAK